MPSELVPVKQMDLPIRGMYGTGCSDRIEEGYAEEARHTPPCSTRILGMVPFGIDNR